MLSLGLNTLSFFEALLPSELLNGKRKKSSDVTPILPLFHCASFSEQLILCFHRAAC